MFKDVFLWSMKLEMRILSFAQKSIHLEPPIPFSPSKRVSPITRSHALRKSNDTFYSQNACDIAEITFLSLFTTLCLLPSLRSKLKIISLSFLTSCLCLRLSFILRLRCNFIICCLRPSSAVSSLHRRSSLRNRTLYGMMDGSAEGSVMDS